MARFDCFQPFLLHGSDELRQALSRRLTVRLLDQSLRLLEQVHRAIVQ
jgi:hypothetical protein